MTTSSTPSPFAAGETSLIVKMPEAEPIVSRWRERFDPSAAYGVPAHVTILYPFLEHARIDGRVVTELRELFAAHPSFEARFVRCGRFPGILYLVPEPERRFIALTEAVVARWPEAPPYRGQFDEVIPHLTVADGDDLDAIEAEIAARLPVVARARSVSLEVFDGETWHRHAVFPLR
ncbi:2'-5' RNA ligase family protein [Microtetraspora sp. AC03309]|uniref:2'-5' RNA ligase family protein n=1 Tax=Microtetraspora sp. AC03309 TaxID=2779376 RepID=UPI001E4C751E|nr:2'-5' RNA ligase family protein [Microtetraspora sp. AC03309]